LLAFLFSVLDPSNPYSSFRRSCAGGTSRRRSFSFLFLRGVLASSTMFPIPSFFLSLSFADSCSANGLVRLLTSTLAWTLSLWSEAYLFFIRPLKDIKSCSSPFPCYRISVRIPRDESSLEIRLFKPLPSRALQEYRKLLHSFPAFFPFPFFALQKKMLFPVCKFPFLKKIFVRAYSHAMCLFLLS